MPDIALHAIFGSQVKERLAQAIQAHLVDAPYSLALCGPDPWFVHFPPKKQEGRGRRMHTTRTGPFLMALAGAARKDPEPDPLFSYLAGFLCHYALDATAHPYIIRRTTTEFQRHGAHRDFEHALDIKALERLGLWGQRHPVTASLMPPLSLPKSMKAGLDAVYRQVYGWEHAWRDAQRDYRLFRWLYRLMEAPHGLGMLLVRLHPSESMRSLVYAASWFDQEGIDVENTGHAPWAHSHDDTLISTETFADLVSRARDRAVSMIEAAHAYVYTGTLDESALATAIGSDSYLSGLPMGDPRNRVVPSMMPASGSEI